MALCPLTGGDTCICLHMPMSLSVCVRVRACRQLRPDEGGQHDIPPTEILPTGQEIYAAVKVFARSVLDAPLA
jgi:hypothetical protein